MIRPQAARQPQAGSQCAVKWDGNLKPKLAIMRQCTSVYITARAKNLICPTDMHTPAGSASDKIYDLDL